MADLSTLKEILAEMRTLANPAARESMARFGIQAENVIGLSVPQIRLIARRTSRSQPVAEQLWDTGIHDARILASLVADPNVISPETMDKWAQETDSWDICDACCGNLFDRTPHAWRKIRQWAPDEREFVRRAAFATLATIAVHDKKAPDHLFMTALPLIEKYAFDDRNFARKGLNWALRNIGKRNPVLRKAAIACAERVRDQNSKASRWIGTDALRELKTSLI
jgi:3-methyladenine DNA glycosylase AlkD